MLGMGGGMEWKRGEQEGRVIEATGMPQGFPVLMRKEGNGYEGTECEASDTEILLG